VEGALHRDDVLLACDATHHLERSLDRLRARTQEEERVKRRVRHDGKQTLYEAQIWLMVGDGALIIGWLRIGWRGVAIRGERAYLSMHEIKALIRRCFAHFWMAMTWFPPLSASNNWRDNHETHPSL
jgi:hypothetical protein